MNALAAFIHHLAAFTLVSALVLEKVHLRDAAAALGGGVLDAEIARKLLRADRIYGISAGVILLVGISRVLWFEKGPGYYVHSIPFIVKVSAFALVGLASIVPTVEFVRWGKALKAGQPVAVDAAKIAQLRGIMLFENAGVVVIILCAALMAKGIGAVG